jgi:predicted transcriptional regulator
MSFTQLIEEIEKLSPQERELVQMKLDALQHGNEIEESPELLAAIEEGIRSAEEGPLIPIEEMMEKVKTWRIKSP